MVLLAALSDRTSANAFSPLDQVINELFTNPGRNFSAFPFLVKQPRGLDQNWLREFDEAQVGQIFNLCPQALPLLLTRLQFHIDLFPLFFPTTAIFNLD